MKLALLASLLVTSVATAQPSAPDWTDLDALLAATTAPIDAAIRACNPKRAPPIPIGFVVARTKSGETTAYMPLPSSVGYRGLSAEERCQMKTLEKLEVPALPPLVQRLGFGHSVVAAGAPSLDATFAEWRDLPAVLATFTDADHRAKLAACGKRIVQLKFDARGTKTRVWLPDWQFHSPSGDGTTPPRERTRRSCLTKAIRGWTAPAWPANLGDIDLAIPAT